jgi:hypothetical protein
MTFGHAIAALFCALAGSTLAASPHRELEALDEYLGRYYAAARDTVKEAAQCLQADQQEWVKNVRDRCGTNDCLRGAYLDRLAELDALQPGATALKNVQLPRRPALAWIVPPAADKVAAPPNPRATPFSATGVILDEVAQGDGIVLRDDAGKRYVLMMPMFLEGASQDRLQLMARQKDARYTVRGHLADAKTVEPSRCLFIHRHPSGEGRVLTDVVSHPGFRPYELPFVLPTDGVARAEFRSEPFYAVILETFPACFDTEAARARVQALYPRNKVFATRFGCQDGEPERIDYTNVARNWGFMAIFAGTGEEEAKAFFEKVKQEGRFRGANLRRMQAVLVYP